MLSIEERRKRANKKLDRYERQAREKRLEARREREAQKKVQQRHNYAVGELVLKYFPQIVDLAKFEQILSVLASTPMLTVQLEAWAVGKGTERSD